MKRVVPIFLPVLIITIFLWSERNSVQSIKDVFARTMENRDAMSSFRATIEDFDSQGKNRADIEYLVDNRDWVMKGATTNDTIFTIFEWRKIGDDLYILNTDSEWFWEIPSRIISLPKRVDVRTAISEIYDALQHKKLRVTRIGSEPCGERLCWRYQLVDPSFAIVERYWWIDSSEFRIMKDQFVIGNGETSITTYEYEGEIKIDIPKLRRDAPADADIMTLPGTVKNLLTPELQKSV